MLFRGFGVPPGGVGAAPGARRGPRWGVRTEPQLVVAGGARGLMMAARPKRDPTDPATGASLEHFLCLY